MTDLGAPGVGAIVALENLFPPIPSEVVLPLAGFLAGAGVVERVHGHLGDPWICSWRPCLYALGAVLGRDRLHQIADRLPLVSVHDVERAEDWFGRQGGRAVFLGRLVPLVRSLISIPAGVARMPLPRFLAYTVAGSGIWNPIFVLLGYTMGSQWHRVGQYSTYLNNAVIVVAVVVFAARRLRRTRGKAQ